MLYERTVNFFTILMGSLAGCVSTTHIITPSEESLKENAAVIIRSKIISPGGQHLYGGAKWCNVGTGRCFYSHAHDYNIHSIHYIEPGIYKFDGQETLSLSDTVRYKNRGDNIYFKVQSGDILYLPDLVFDRSHNLDRMIVGTTFVAQKTRVENNFEKAKAELSKEAPSIASRMKLGRFMNSSLRK